MGCGGHLAALRRVRTGRFDVKDAISFEDLKALPRAEFASRLLPLDSI